MVNGVIIPILILVSPTKTFVIEIKYPTIFGFFGFVRFRNKALSENIYEE